MTVKLSTASRNSRLDALIAAIGASAQIRVFSGSRPANVAAAETGTLLAELTGDATAFAAAAAGGASTANPITQDAGANNSGTAIWERIRTSGGTAVVDIDVSNVGGGGELELVTTTIVAGQPVQIIALTLTEGGA
jgi:hypothetical protein